MLFRSEQALLVAPVAPGPALPCASREVRIVAELCPSLQLKPVMPSPRREEVLAHLPACKIFHFAGQGSSDRLLLDWGESPLTVGDLWNCRIQESSPFLAYLAADSTGVNMGDELDDEGTHLASAFQLAGFRHVIGTLRGVSDEHCVGVARVFYETIRDEGITDMAICQGLHLAVKTLRDGCIEEMVQRAINEELCEESHESLLESPQYWALYIHFGV